MKVILEKLHPDAQLPVKAHDDDFCYDVYAINEEEIAPNIWKYRLGFAYEIKRDNCKYVPFSVLSSNLFGNAFKFQDLKISIDFRPRSSVWKTGMILSNCEGTLDEPYRGEASAIFYHVIPNMPRYKIGDRIGQIKLGFTIPIEFEWGEIDKNTDRSTNGFGSTGK